MTELAEIVVQNVAEVRAKIARAAEQSGRSADDILLVAVTKYVDVNITRCLCEAGCHDLGESRPQSLWQKFDQLQDVSVDWHMIGHLQRNKIRRTLTAAKWIHSADSVRLLDALNEEASRLDYAGRALLEVNISGDAEKTGFLPEQAVRVGADLAKWESLDVCGLMAMSGRNSGPAAAQRDFEQVRLLRDKIQENCPESRRLHHLSMGMSRDYELAIREGATVVRVGSALFEGIRE